MIIFFRSSGEILYTFFEDFPNQSTQRVILKHSRSNGAFNKQSEGNERALREQIHCIVLSYPRKQIKFFRLHCGLQGPTSWLDKPAQISQSNWENMESVYTNVEDIDAFTGAISEIPVPGGLVGPTVACILGQQFRDLILGDR